MGRTYDAIDDSLRAFLCRQPVFFTGTAPLAADGHVNVSPKGLAGTFAVLTPKTVAYLDLTGSGVETIAHLRENGRITLMFCAFEGAPRIVRLAGNGTAVLASDPRFGELRRHFLTFDGVRSIVVVELDRIADSCGYGVPQMNYVADRAQLPEWAHRRGEDGIAAYQREKNVSSIDGLVGVPASESS